MTPRCALSFLRRQSAPAPPPKRLRGLRQPKDAIRADWRCSAEACQTCIAGNPHDRPRTQVKGRASTNARAGNRRHTTAPRAGFGFLDSEIRGWMHKAMKPLEGVAKVARPTSAREIHDAKLVTAIEASFKASDRTYGARRVWRDALEEGLACGLHRIERLMWINALRARPRRRGKPKDDGERSVIADIEPVNAPGSREPARPRPGLPGRAAKPEVAGRFHLYLDRGRLAVCRRHSGPVLAACRRLVDEGRAGRVTGHGCADDGRLATWKGRRPASSSGSGIAIHK